MRIILQSHSLYIIGAIVFIGVALYMLFLALGQRTPEWVTTTVDRGDVRAIVFVSGVVEAENTAHLSFPINDIVSDVLVSEGDIVERGDTLATMQQANLLANRRDAAASLQIAIADRNELLSGPTEEERALTTSGVTNTEEDLVRTIREEEEKVANAYRALLSNNLAAQSDDPNDGSETPTITGTYECTKEGIYVLDVFSSSAKSGYSYRLTGLGSGTHTVSTDHSSPLDGCGLRIQFDETSRYSNSSWSIEIPNTNASTYVTYLNAYNITVERAQNAVASAEEALDIAIKEQSLENASPRDEALLRANARVMQASARVAAVDAQILERTLIAPFSGVITDVDIVIGEKAGVEPIITMVAEDLFELRARIPEIDIAKIAINQHTEAVFDAKPSIVVQADITFISPLATEIDGVAYFKASLSFTEPPLWLRGGMNADIDIVVAEKIDTLRIPKRFLIETDGVYSILIPDGKRLNEIGVEVGFIGNDGFVEIIGLNEGDIIVAP